MKTLTNNSNTLSTQAIILALAISLLSALCFNPVSASESKPAVASTQTLHKTINIDGVEIYYREAGPVDAPT
ncbi:MAG: hypothetical protein DRQ44_09550, partial [Gammaproteobacteria bacterium]